MCSCVGVCVCVHLQQEDGRVVGNGFPKAGAKDRFPQDCCGGTLKRQIVWHRLGSDDSRSPRPGPGSLHFNNKPPRCV